MPLYDLFVSRVLNAQITMQARRHFKTLNRNGDFGAKTYINNNLGPTIYLKMNVIKNVKFAALTWEKTLFGLNIYPVKHSHASSS